MTGVLVVMLVAVAVVLLAAVAVVVLRLRTALQGLRDAGDSSAGAVRPMVDELTEAGQVTSVESAELQASIERLRTGWRADAPSTSRRP